MVIIGAKAVMLVAVVWGAAGLIVSTFMLPLPVSPESGVKCTGNCTVQWVTCQCTIAGQCHWGSNRDVSVHAMFMWQRCGRTLIMKLLQNLPRHKGHYVSPAGRGNAGAAVTSQLAAVALTVRRLLVEGQGDLSSSSAARFKRAERRWDG